MIFKHWGFLGFSSSFIGNFTHIHIITILLKITQPKIRPNNTHLPRLLKPWCLLQHLYPKDFVLIFIYLKTKINEESEKWDYLPANTRVDSICGVFLCEEDQEMMMEMWFLLSHIECNWTPSNVLLYIHSLSILLFYLLSSK